MTSAHRWPAYWISVAIAALTILDMTKVNVALPSIEHALGANSTQLQLVISGYILTFGLALVPAGRLGDQRSRKVLFIVGLSIFTLTSLIAGFASDPGVLIAARLVQGIGAGIQMPQVTGLIQELFQGAERGRAFGLFGATIGIATAFGPTAGGALIGLGGDEWGWRLMFLVNLPLGVAAIIATLIVMPNMKRDAPRRPLSMDPVGIVIFAIMVVALMWPFLFTTGSPSDDPNRWWTLAIFAIGVLVFVWWETRYAHSGRHPLIALGLLRTLSFRNGVLISTLYFAATPPMFLLGTLLIQDGLGLSAMVAGMTTITFALVSAWTSWWGGLLVARAGRRLIVLGVTLVLVSVLLMIGASVWVPHEAMPWAMSAVMIIGGAGGGFVLSSNQTLMLSDIPVTEGGLAGSVGQLGQRIGSAIGSAVALSIFYSTAVREAGTVPGEQIAFDGFRLGMFAVAGLLVLSLVVAILDMVRARPRPVI
ncbi:MFS transporter [Microbacterium gorillae]|uniref:MFS transporter n=1 Tax=Microbacterium gorillae TaxID=1231063 RepID=UPI00069327F1|nr:MFS transporter [Microbacterium gorillae]